MKYVYLCTDASGLHLLGAFPSWETAHKSHGRHAARGATMRFEGTVVKGRNAQNVYADEKFVGLIIKVDFWESATII